MLSVSVQCSPFSQHEKMRSGALGVLAKQCMMSKFRNETFSMIDLNQVTKIHMLPRIDKKLLLHEASVKDCKT